MLHEGLSLVGMAQQHVYSVIGVAAEERVPPFLIYADDGTRNLKRYYSNPILPQRKISTKHSS